MRISSAVLVQTNGWQRSFQPSMKAPIAATRSLTEVKVPRRMACRVMIPKKISTWVSQLPEVGVKCSLNARMLGQPLLDRGVLVGAVVVADHVQRHPWVGAGELAEEGQELLVAVPLIAGVGACPVATFSAANKVVVPCRM